MSNNIIIVTEEDRNMVQRANLECQSRADIIAFMIERNMDISTERFAEYQKAYENAFLAFEQAKAYIQNKYLKDIVAVYWSLDYSNCELSYVV